MTEPLHCPFEKAILSTQCGCTFSTRYQVGERTGVGCESAMARQDCLTFRRLLRENARFALGVKDATEALPFGKERKLLFGGLAGLYEVLDAEGQAGQGMNDIHGLVAHARRQFLDLERVPYDKVVRAVVAYRSPRRSPGRER
jgi:hypothetical protein